ncbi:C-type mannose receptor 2-like [Poeciliopsis prolifica]|uniref:C-type mannose receptor 2-like n=1 Tax=Poeciliopsis prolifica TaxID=188132 RepID=UPI0024144FF3|nr:C-type mannose receptor 2-like [Poeciliopsis prolifica]
MQWSLILLFLMAQCCFIDCQLYEFHYINENKTWTEAQQYCREKHTDLVTVTNMKDMKRLINISDGDIKGAWIGVYNQTNGTRTWYWSLPGLEFNESETNWAPNEPTDKGNQGSENCGIVYQNLKWLDQGCKWPEYFLCYDETNTTNKYLLIKDKKTWTEAQSYCRENHTDLISGMKQLQDEEVKKLMNSSDNKAYFGLFRDNWRWSDGSSFYFRHWKKDFNNSESNSGQCAMTVFDDGSRWRNENCDERKPFICYDDKVILIKENKTWHEALTYCRDHHDDLVTITNMDDQRWIQEKVKNASTDYVWMGLHYAWTLQFWIWVSDEEVSYENWAESEPMDDCDVSGAMETRGGHKWFRRNDDEKLNFICSKYYYPVDLGIPPEELVQVAGGGRAAAFQYFNVLHPTETNCWRKIIHLTAKMQWSLILLFLMAQCCFIDCQLYEFHYIKEAKNWTEAQQYCREKHTDLVTVTNMKDMKRLIRIADGNKKEAWIGLYNQTHGTRTWYWSLPGLELNENETNWAPEEPNDGGHQGSENCVIVNKDIKWIDILCQHKYNFLCYNETNTTHKYHLIREEKSWLEAQSYCREKHTDLISGTKQLQDEELKEVMKTTWSKSFIGLFRDTWRWSDGSSFSFRHWNLQFYNQIINSGQCALTVFDDGGRWRNEKCDEKKPFICYDDKLILINKR